MAFANAAIDGAERFSVGAFAELATKGAGEADEALAASASNGTSIKTMKGALPRRVREAGEPGTSAEVEARGRGGRWRPRSKGGACARGWVVKATKATLSRERRKLRRCNLNERVGSSSSSRMQKTARSAQSRAGGCGAFPERSLLRPGKSPGKSLLYPRNKERLGAKLEAPEQPRRRGTGHEVPHSCRRPSALGV
jgi:hypothetical protein